MKGDGTGFPGTGRLLASPGNTEAPPIPHLGRRIRALFIDYRGRLALTALLVVAGAALSVAVPLLTQRAFDEGLFPPDGSGVNLDRLTGIVGLMVLATILGAVLTVWRTYLTTLVGNGVMADIRSRLFSGLQKMELSFFTGTRTGVIQSRLSNDVSGVSGVLTNTLPSILANVVTVVSAVVAMLVLSWQLTIVALILVPPLVVLQLRIGKVRQQLARRTQESLSEMTAITQETLSVSGIILSKVFNQQEAEVRRYATENARQARLQLRQQMTGQRFFAAVQVFMNATPALVYLAAGWLLAASGPAPGGNAGGIAGGALTAGTLVAFTTLQARITMPVMSLMRVSLEAQTSLALFARIFEYMDLEPAITDRPGARRIEPREVAGRIELERVSFAYPAGTANGDAANGGADRQDRPAWALKDVSLTIEPGTFAAFVGPSGSGKTTLSYLIPRLYEVTDGAIRLDGRDIRDITLDSLSASIGMVTQETYLFHASIADNLRYARPDATDEELAAAAKVANIHERILGFDDGYDTIVGERGYRLSGGEKQRLAIARVVLKDPPILILDEATSALDTASERLVQQALEKVMRNRTTVAIAHRLSTITAADVIFVLNGGQIVESGSHEELLARNGLYTDLYGQQYEAV